MPPSPETVEWHRIIRTSVREYLETSSKSSEKNYWHLRSDRERRPKRDLMEV